ncbi:MAG TPA: 30S ribosomal protein S20 [Thermoanaerobaculia bacterium]|jgi:small subunit ribosomal protein S20|nr:30S ribosomal protein S20 [Thermoanaerobaculia bacterium]
MANIRSAEKQRRQAEKAAVRNRGGKSRLRGALKKARTAIEAGNTEPKVLGAGYSEIDKAAKRGIIKENTANRYKSRLTAAAKRVAAK